MDPVVVILAAKSAAFDVTIKVSRYVWCFECNCAQVYTGEDTDLIFVVCEMKPSDKK